MIDETMPVIVVAPHDRVFEKTVSNMQEVAARGGRIILITDEAGARAGAVKAAETIVLPDMHEILTPIVYAVPLQLLAYYAAVHMGTDVDQPRKPRQIRHRGVAPLRIPGRFTGGTAVGLAESKELTRLRRGGPC